MIRSPAGFDGGDRIKRYLDYYQPSYGVTMLSPGQFSPASLFAAGEQGAWYDPSDISTMFQDSAGATPVTAVEQPVGLILDKSGRGNNASQATPGARPTLSARVNQFTYSEQFNNNTVWTKIGGSISTDSVAPDGTLTADLFTEDNLNQDHYVAYTFSGASGPAYTFSVFVKPNGRTWIILNAYDGTRKAVWFNCTGAGSVGTTDAGVTNPTIAAVGGGWYRLTSTRTAAAGTFYPAIVPTTGDGVSPPYLGDGTSGFYLWGADLRVTNDGVGLPAYQRIAAATDYDTTGFPLYLRFDGSDDSLATAAIDFSATDKVSLFAGVRKLSDAAQSVVAELTASIALNNGAFALTAPNSAAANYNFSSKGTTQVNNIVTTYTAPLTSVLTGLGDISGPANTLRINGAQVGSVTTTQGTGNYANAALYIGRRGGTTLPYNGRLYSLIVRGAQSTSAQIASTETWVNGKTEAY